MSRTYERRCQDRLERLRQRAAFLQTRIDRPDGVERTHDKGERSAILWAIEEIERWTTVVEVLNSVETDKEKLAVIATLVRSRRAERAPAGE